MALILGLNRRKQGVEPEIIGIEHNGETIYIKVDLKTNSMIRVQLEGSKNFKIFRVKQDEIGK